MFRFTLKAYHIFLLLLILRYRRVIVEISAGVWEHKYNLERSKMFEEGFIEQTGRNLG